MRRGLLLAILLTGCPEQVGVIAQDPSGTAAGEGEPRDTAPRPPAARSGAELEEDERMTEPDHPAVKSPQERALVHVHTPADVCSGVLVAPRLVATAHQCFAPGPAGVVPVAEKDREAYRVEVASSTLTWTARHVQAVVLPACDWRKLDLAILVLDDAAPSAPASAVSAPAQGASVQALGFGKCRGDTKPFSGRTGSVLERHDADIVVDVLLCQGDVGGGAFDPGAGGYLGVISRKGESRAGAGAATTVVRFDTQRARELLAVADGVAKGAPPAKTDVACE